MGRGARTADVDDEAEPIASPVRRAERCAQALPHNGVMVLDAGNAGKHMRVFIDTYEPGTFMSISDWASVGAAFPIALGVKLARPERPVMATVGDMGMMCNIGELETAVRERIPVVCVVFNDHGLGNERAYQKELYGGRIYAVDYGDVDFGGSRARWAPTASASAARPTSCRRSGARSRATGPPWSTCSSTRRPRRCSSNPDGRHNADKGTERAADSNRGRNAGGRAAAPLLAPDRVAQELTDDNPTKFVACWARTWSCSRTRAATSV